MIEWTDEFYKIYFRIDDNFKTISQKLWQFVGACCDELKSEKKEKGN